MLKEAAKKIAERLAVETDDSPYVGDLTNQAPGGTEQMINALERVIAQEFGRLIMDTPPRFTPVPSDHFVNGRYQAKATGVAAQLIGYQADRMRITLHNEDSSNACYIGSDENMADDANGFALAAGETVTLETRAAIYVRTASANVLVHYLIEFGD